MTEAGPVSAPHTSPEPPAPPAPSGKAPAGTAIADDTSRWRYGLIAVLAGAVVIAICFVVAVIRYKSAADVATAVGPVATAIGTLAGAYFGIQAGSAGKAQSEASKDDAHAQAMQFAAIAEPGRALQLLGIDPNGSGLRSPR